MAAKDKIIFPLDLPTVDEALKYVRLLKDDVGFFKVGLELFVAAGPEVLQCIREAGGAGIFLDLKFHDIPQTVKNACLSAKRHGARLITVHSDGGQRLLEAAVQGMKGSGTKVLAVTALTSLNAEDYAALGYKEGLSVHSIVLSRARMALDTGCDGIVCSGHETKAVREVSGPGFIIVNPGIRPDWDWLSGDDQKRMVTPSEAIRNGADYIVVGRPIRLADDPVKAARRIAQEMAPSLT